MYTSAGQQQDLNHLWQQVQELSNVLAHNREVTAGVARSGEELHHRNTSGIYTGEVASVNGHTEHGEGTRELELLQENQALHRENGSLRTENEDLSMLIQDYETVLEKVLEGLRIYAHENSVATINVHSSYTNQLAAERASNATLRQKEIENEGRLTTISGLIRLAYQEQTELGADNTIEKLEMENEVLREALGLGKIPVVLTDLPEANP